MRIYKNLNRIYQHVQGLPIFQNGKGKLKMYSCSDCHYESKRQYNIQRHQWRIHINRKPRLCCGTMFLTKGDYYVHCEKVHPQKRSQAQVSKTKYKITSDFPTRDNFQSSNHGVQVKTRFSTRIRMRNRDERTNRNVSFQCSLSYSDIDDIPLISFLRDNRLMSFLEKCCATTKMKDSRKSDTSETVEIAISTEKKVENFASTSEVKNSRTEIYTSFAYSSRELPAKKLILQRFRTAVSQTMKLPLKKRGNKSFELKNRTKSIEGRLQREDEYEQIIEEVDKENIPMYAFNFQQQVSVKFDNEIVVPSTTKLHRDYLSSIDFERYKIF